MGNGLAHGHLDLTLGGNTQLLEQLPHSIGFPCKSPLHSRWTGFDVDRIPSLLEAPCETLDTLTVPEPVTRGGAEFPIRLVADEDRKHTDQDGVSDGDHRALLPPSCGQPAEERRQIGSLGRSYWIPGSLAPALPEKGNGLNKAIEK
jgi:hypothetical protein